MEEKDLLQNSCGGFPYPVTTQGELESFSCGDKDLDDFFHQDAFLYAEQLLGKLIIFPQQELTRRLFVLLRWQMIVSKLL